MLAVKTAVKGAKQAYWVTKLADGLCSAAPVAKLRKLPPGSFHRVVYG